MTIFHYEKWNFKNSDYWHISVRSKNSGYQRLRSEFFELSKQVLIPASFQRQIIFCFVLPIQLIQVQDVTGMSSAETAC